MAESGINELTEYQMKFVDAYMKTGDKKKALIAAGYKGKGKHSTMTSMAHKTYKNPKVYAEIERRRKLLANKNIVDAQQIVERLTKMFNGELTSEMVLKNGQMVEVPISFKNQIEAAKVLVNILGIQAQLQNKPEEKQEMQKMAEDLKALTNEFLSNRAKETVKNIPDNSKAEDADVDED